MKLRNLVSTAVAAGMVLAPIAAQAGTRASVSNGVASTVESNGGGRSSKGVATSESMTGLPMVLLALLAVGGGIAAASSGGDSKSRGAS